jgi:hypothetical protein
VKPLSPTTTAHLLHCRERWGIYYHSVRDLEAFAPVITRLRRLESQADASRMSSV